MIVYLHGFNSSPQSSKAQYLKQYLEARGGGGEFACPQLPHRPDLAVAVNQGGEEIGRASCRERV